MFIILHSFKIYYLLIIACKYAFGRYNTQLEFVHTWAKSYHCFELFPKVDFT